MGERWEVIYCKGLHQTSKRKRSKLYGCCVWQYRKLVIDVSCPRFEAIDTLYHEMAHVYVAKLTAENSKLRENEEILVDLFAKSFADATANNRLPSESC